MPKDRDAFVAGKLAVYFGYASEVDEIRAANPNLDFDVALVPQTADKRLTFGKMHAVALLKSSPKVASAWQAANFLTNAQSQKFWVEQSGLPPVRREMLGTLPGDEYKSIFYQSALISSAWLDPYRESTNGIFMRLVENVTSGRLRVSESVGTASVEIDNLLRRN
jgi:ABC-type glycerol-3-phosphate transport system substrate-binding protein